jgi:hypothetical protein
MLEFFRDNIFVVVVGQAFQESLGIPMGTNCAPFLAGLFLYSYRVLPSDISYTVSFDVSISQVLWPLE